MPISRMQNPRQLYGLGSIVKSIGKTVKKVAKSPIGKAALLYAGGSYLSGLGAFGGLKGAGSLSGIFSGGGAGLGSMFTKAKNLYTGLSGAQKLMGAGSLGLAALAGAPEEVQMESQRDVGALRKYLSSYYQNLGYSADQIAENVARDTSEYTSGQGGYAMGGRVNYQDGTSKNVILPKAKPRESSGKRILDLLANNKQGAINTLGAKGLFNLVGQSAVQAYRKGEISKSQYDSMIKPFFGEPSERLSKRVFEETKELRANGGRMGYEDGTENPLAKLLEDIPLTKGPYKIKRDKDGKIIPPPPPLRGPYKIKRDKDGKIIPSPPPLLLRNKSAYGGRINRAYGSDDLVEQASGMEGLDININPKGVKELDLRETGGFIPPVGVKEKADDIPAMLSNNEFVFTADAVRAAGGGSVNKGAQVMYDAMKKLENGGTV